ncbi:unnamed protein product [Didymodactylos carnosus]|uniref:Uncharacterized protein n=1 Tax=Didymodactylos carnosus TaxID=1234261 RepID=A0A8S2DTZ0_9BILA|nr:unnamed protein product [Didymodactylos carnosus]CAF3777330.1 unnamed protein product [Didymodactylos carnosus]
MSAKNELPSSELTEVETLLLEIAKFNPSLTHEENEDLSKALLMVDDERHVSSRSIYEELIAALEPKPVRRETTVRKQR